MSGAEARSEVITEYLLRALAHKIRTPLAVIANESYVLAKTTPASEELRIIQAKSKEISELLGTLEEYFYRRATLSKIDLLAQLRTALGTSFVGASDQGPFEVDDDGSWLAFCAGLITLLKTSGGYCSTALEPPKTLRLRIDSIKGSMPVRESSLFCELFEDIFIPALPCMDVILSSIAQKVEGRREGVSAIISITIR